MSVVHAPSADGSALSEVDRLFATLDGMVVSNGLGEWSSRIQGIYADGPYVWVQLSRDDEDMESVDPASVATHDRYRYRPRAGGGALRRRFTSRCQGIAS